ncbi:MAG: hypothetical protein ACI8QC_004452 [Planctomycetota bacterium]|jgi:hypothetical protein
MSKPLRLAMWSGPRNISTALMRSFGARPDAQVCDEPLYAYYLRETGLLHPVRDTILREHENDWRKVVAELSGPLQAGKNIYYQKHMAHHLLPEMDRAWLDGFESAFLIREPRAMLASLIEKLDAPVLEDTGLPQQVALFEAQRERTGRTPIVIDSKDLLLDPAGMLTQLCERVGLEFDPRMLAWEPGVHPTDGCWAEYWYGNALASTGFAPYRERQVQLPASYEELARTCEQLYAQLHPQRLTSA